MSMTKSAGLALLIAVVSFVGPAIADVPVGWRSDGTGSYPKTNPPRQWSKKTNVLWKVRMPGRSHGSPIVVGDRLFVVSDPAELLCIRASDGKVLWQETNTAVEVFGPVKAREIADAYGRLDEQRNKLSREHNKLRKDEPDAKEKHKQLRDRIEALEKERRKLGEKWPRKGNSGGAGNTAATPVSDGKHVVAVFGNGIVAAYTTEGKRLWIKFVESSHQGFGHSASPILLDGKVIVHFKDLTSLDLRTGKELWRTEVPASHASPLVARLEKENVIVTPSGSLVRPDDGKVIGKGKFHTSESSPVLHDGALYVSRPGSLQAFKLTGANEGTVLVEELWKASGAGDRRTPSSVTHDGLLYAVNTAGILDVTDTKTGEAVYRQRLPVRDVYSSLAVAGGLLYVFDTRGKAVLVKTGRRFEQVGLNELEGTGTCPIFVGDRLYVRAQQHLYCLAATGEKQKEK